MPTGVGSGGHGRHAGAFIVIERFDPLTLPGQHRGIGLRGVKAFCGALGKAGLQHLGGRFAVQDAEGQLQPLRERPGRGAFGPPEKGRIQNDRPSCLQQALGVVHGAFQMVPLRFKDYVSTPKPNGYRSIHTDQLGGGR